MRLRLLVIGALAVFGPLALATRADAAKVGTDATVDLTEGASHDINFQLDAPIIGPLPGASVTVDLTVDDPSRVTLSAASLHWANAEWPQIRTETVTALHDGVHDATNTVVVHFTATSEAAYYDGFTGSFTVNLTDIDPAPTTTTSTTTLPTTTTTSAPVASTTTIAVAPIAQLPRTGGPSNREFAVGLLAITTGTAVTALARRRAVSPR
jgi:hypothetical protein